jgi:death-on-curing protein
MNGRRLTMSNDEAYDLIHAVASGQLDDVPDIAKLLRRHTDVGRR